MTSKSACKFQRSWLSKSSPYYSWVQKSTYDTDAFCKLCKKVINLSHMGEGALKSHTMSVKHRLFSTASKSSPRIAEFFAQSQSAREESCVPLSTLTSTAAPSAALPSTEERVSLMHDEQSPAFKKFKVNERVTEAEDSDLPKPIEKRSYNKEDVPTCHDFNTTTATADRVSLLVGLLGGQVQLFDPITKEVNKSYNSGERLIDKSKVTCIKWIPKSMNQFLVSHSSGQMYMYNEELVCGLDRPIYQLFKQGEGFCVYTCKTRSTRNPLYRWSIGEGCINEFTFSPCSKYLAVVSQDGYLRVFNFDTMDLVGSARSYYGGLLCVCWSPDGKYVVTGGEDDLITVWSFHEKRVVARGQGHKSWVTVVAFDPYTTIYADNDSLDGSSEEKSRQGLLKTEMQNCKTTVNSNSINSSNRNSLSSDGLVMPVTSYRLGSVGQDTLLCLWDLKDDILKQPYFRPRSSTAVSSSKSSGNVSMNIVSNQQTSSCQNSSAKPNNLKESIISNDHSHHSYSSSLFTSKLANLNFGEKRDKEKQEKDHKRSLSLASKTSSTYSKNTAGKNNLSGGLNQGYQNSFKLVGTPMCPRLEECPMLEPMVCKKIGHERLCGLIFREDSIITSCQDGCILTWCRPGSHSGLNHHSSSSPTGILMGGAGNSAGGTVV